MNKKQKKLAKKLCIKLDISYKEVKAHARANAESSECPSYYTVWAVLDLYRDRVRDNLICLLEEGSPFYIDNTAYGYNGIEFKDLRKLEKLVKRYKSWKSYY